MSIRQDPPQQIGKIAKERCTITLTRIGRFLNKVGRFLNSPASRALIQPYLAAPPGLPPCQVRTRMPVAVLAIFSRAVWAACLPGVRREAF